MDKENHAESNARASYENIAEMVAALECDYERLEDLKDDLERVHNENQEDDTQKDVPFEAWVKKQAAADDEDAKEYLELVEAATLDGDLLEDAETARERIQERPLSVQVRSGWYTPGECLPPKPEEFEILLTTGGPALRIVGELDEHGEPYRAWLEYQDWGTPWTQFFGYDRETLLSFCRCFYFGS